MPLHPQTQGLLQAMAAMPAVDFASITAPELRQRFDTPGMFAPGDTVAAIENSTIPTAYGDLPIRIYRPQAAGALPVLIYFHGGGFVTGTLDTHDNICRCLAHRAACLVVSVAYRLAPEAPFPAAVDDAWLAFNWLQRNAAEIGGDGSRMAVAGDSSGGNLAAVTAQRAARERLPLRHQLLLYPVTDCGGEGRGYEALGEQGYFLTTTMMRWYFSQYLPNARSAADPSASPLRQLGLAGVAEATVITAGYDLLRAEAEDYAQALQQAGVPVTVRCWPGQVHGFASMLGVLDDADEALGFAAERLRQAFA